MNNEKNTFEDLTKRQFKLWSSFYDSGLNRLFYFERIYERVIKTIKHEAGYNLKPGVKFLDVACGTGEIIFRLAQEFPHVEFVGVDFSEAMLEKAIEKTKGLNNVKIFQANIRNLPFSDASFDLVLCSDAFHHFASPEESLQEINRVAKQGSFFLLVDPAFDTIFQKLVVGLFGKIFETAKKYYSEKEIVSLLQDTDFVMRRKFAYYFTNFFINRKR